MGVPGQDHPRSRGVYRYIYGGDTWRNGSSPLARGLLRPRRVNDIVPRIIPARAGFTRGPGLVPLLSQDHPRSRGVYRGQFTTKTSRGGSSPLARGLPEGHLSRLCPPGIIPARAGFTTHFAATIASAQDHPRSRGVYRQFLRFWRARAGSSPLARGLPPPTSCVMRMGGIIPARAEFTRHIHRRPPPRPDHPRSRGVYLFLSVWGLDSTGSSPLARGLPWHAHSIPGWTWIIPARAGFTVDIDPNGTAAMDHPRSRGVY